jgi:short-subunit dehydrogenase
MPLARPVTLITGASSGIGTELVDVFARHGHELVLVARRTAELTLIADRMASLGRPRPHVLPIDLAQRDASDRIEQELASRGLEPAVIVNNAGVGLFGDAAGLDRAAQLAMIDLNGRMLTDLSLRFIDSLARNRGGVLNIASLAAFVPGPRLAVYHATKAYALSLSEALHAELKPRGVRVTVVCPGPVATEFQGRSGLPSGHHPNFLVRPAERVARDAYAGFMRGQRVVIPGSHNKVAAVVLGLLPRAIAMRFSGARGGTGGAASE